MVNDNDPKVQLKKYKIVGVSPDGRDTFLHSSGYFGETGRSKAQRRIDTGHVQNYLMPNLKDYEFSVVEEKAAANV